MNIRIKILLMFLVVVIVAGGVATLVGRSVAAGMLEDEIEAHLVSTAQSKSTNIQHLIEYQKQLVETKVSEVSSYNFAVASGLAGSMTQYISVISNLMTAIVVENANIRDAFWLDAEGQVVTSAFDNVDLSGVNMSQWDLSKFDWSELDLTRVDFSTLDLSSLDWSQIDLNQLDFTNLDLSPFGMGHLTVMDILNGDVDWSQVDIKPTNADYHDWRKYDWSQCQAFIQGKEAPFIGDIAYGKEGTQFALAVSAPFYTYGRDLAGVLVYLGGEKQLNSITTNRSGLGDSGEVYLLDSRGFMLTPSRFVENAVLRQQVGPSYLTPGIHLQTFSTTNYLDEKVIRVCQPIPGTGWTMVAEMGRSEAMSPLNDLTHRMIWGLLVLVAVGSVIAVLFSRTISGPILRLRHGAEAIIGGSWDYELATSTKDEVGDLSRAFSQMTAKLRQSQRQLEDSNLMLEEKVDDRTRQLSTANTELSREIADRKQAELALYEAKDQAETILNSVEAGVIILDAQQHTVKYVNPAAMEMIGAEKEHLVGRVCHQFICPAEAGKCPVTDLGRVVDASERVLVRSNGEELYILKTVSPITYEGRDCLIETFTDITARKKAEMALEETHDELERKVQERTADLREAMDQLVVEIAAHTKAELQVRRKNEELTLAQQALEQNNLHLEEIVLDRTSQIARLLKQKDEFVAQLAHDLRSPLTPLVALVPMLADKQTMSNVDMEEMVDIIRRNVLYMKNLVEKTVQLASINSERIELDLRPLNAAHLLAEFLERKKHSLAEHNITVENRVASDVTILADELRVVEVLDNLISNAIKFIPDTGGTLTFGIRHEDAFTTLWLKDSGIGLTGDQSTSIFEEFYKGDESRHELGSAGLGLAICDRIMKKHRGRIWAESDGPNKGTTFYLSFPVSLQSER